MYRGQRTNRDKSRPLGYKKKPNVNLYHYGSSTANIHTRISPPILQFLGWEGNIGLATETAGAATAFPVVPLTGAFATTLVAVLAGTFAATFLVVL